jgi:hypothetical protein
VELPYTLQWTNGVLRAQQSAWELKP